jgi:hypothetical protein
MKPASATGALGMSLYAEVGRLGVVVPLAPFRARVGGPAPFQKILNALSVTEKVHPGCPRGMARTTRHAYSCTRGGTNTIATVTIPRAKAALFLRPRPGGKPPLLDGARAGAAENAPLPLPRRLDPACLVPDAPLYSYQEAAVRFLCDGDGPLAPASVEAHRAVAYLQLDTGLGKTRIGLGVVAARGEPALVVVPTEAIGEQWLEELAEVYPDLRGGFYHNPPKKSKKTPPGPATHDVVVVIVNTLRVKPPEFMEGYGTFILDEAHEYHSTHNGRVLWLAQTRAVLGLSATPLERPDGLDAYVCLHLGPPIYPKTIPGFDAAEVRFQGAVRAIEYTGHPAHCETEERGGVMSAICTIGNVLADPARLRLVVAEVARLYHLHETAPASQLAELGLGPRPASAATPTHPEGEIRRHGIFVFAETRAFLPLLRAALLERFTADDLLAPEMDETPENGPAPAISVLRGGAAKGAVGCARKAGAHIVLVTYGFGRRGLSLPDMTAAVNATPRRNGTRQIVGRVLRRGSDESIVRQFVDIVDVCTGLKGQFTDRRKVYKEKGYSLTKLAVSWTEFSADELPIIQEVLDDENPLADLTTEELLAIALGETDS